MNLLKDGNIHMYTFDVLIRLSKKGDVKIKVIEHICLCCHSCGIFITALFCLNKTNYIQ